MLVNAVFVFGCTQATLEGEGGEGERGGGEGRGEGERGGEREGEREGEEGGGEGRGEGGRGRGVRGFCSCCNNIHVITLKALLHSNDLLICSLYPSLIFCGCRLIPLFVPTKNHVILPKSLKTQRINDDPSLG